MWGILKPKRNIIFEAARAKINELVDIIGAGLEGIALDQNKWHRIIPNDPQSPMIMGLGENKHLIYYPENSTPYSHNYENSIKFVEVLSGTIYDKKTGESWKQGDKRKIYPEDMVEPYTTDSEAYVRVCVTVVDTIWENVCV